MEAVAIWAAQSIPIVARIAPSARDGL